MSGVVASITGARHVARRIPHAAGVAWPGISAPATDYANNPIGLMRSLIADSTSTSSEPHCERTHPSQPSPARGKEGSRPSYQPAARILDMLLERAQELRGFDAVDHTMIGGERQRHAVDTRRRDGEYSAQARRGDGVELCDAVHAQIRNLESGVAVFLRTQPPLARPLHQRFPFRVKFDQFARL